MRGLPTRVPRWNLLLLNFDLSISTEVSHWIAFMRDRVDFVRLGPRTSPVFVQRMESSDELSMGIAARFSLELVEICASLTVGQSTIA